jgi:hypothetical protein
VITKILTLMNMLTATILVILLTEAKTHPVTAQAQDRTLRTQRIEITDSQGRVAASLGYDEKTLTPAFTFYDKSGRQTMLLTTNQSGDPSMYFLSRDNGPTVSIGYLAGSDVKPQPGKDDPLGSWGVRVSTEGGVESLDSFNIDPAAKKRLKDSIRPVRVPPN